MRIRPIYNFKEKLRQLEELAELLDLRDSIKELDIIEGEEL